MSAEKPLPRGVRMLRGYWLLEALVDAVANRMRWISLPTKPPTAGQANPAPGRFHEPTGKFWPDRRANCRSPVA